MHTLRSHFPRIGMRIIKSAVAVGLCIVIYHYLFKVEEIPFFLVIAALQSMQPYQKKAKEIAVFNLFGTFVGAACALMILLLQHFVLGPNHSEYIWYCLFITLGIVVSIYSAVVLGHGDAAYFSTVVYLCIVMVHLGDEDPFIYVIQRMAETLLGLGIGTCINLLRIPRRRVKDTLFVAALDDVLHSEHSMLPEYTKVEVNRILDDGVRLSIISHHSTASFWEAAGSIRFKMPVILLDGALLYDPAQKRYISKVELSYEDAMAVTRVIEDKELTLFHSAVIDDSVIIFNDHISDSCLGIYEKMRQSIYRNFIHRPLPEGLNIIYVLCIGTNEALDRACEKLQAQGGDDRYKVTRFAFEDREDMGYLRIYSAEADRMKMLDSLRRVCGLDKLRSFGNDPELYDVCVNTAEGESILKALKKEAEPFFWQRRKS